MTCDDILRLLDEDAPLDGAAATAHLTTCGDCRQKVQRAEAVRRELRALGDVEPPPFLHARVMAHLAARSRPRALRASWAVAGALIAAVAVTVGVRVWWSLRSRPEDVVAVAATQERRQPSSLASPHKADESSHAIAQTSAPTAQPTPAGMLQTPLPRRAPAPRRNVVDTLHAARTDESRSAPVLPRPTRDVGTDAVKGNRELSAGGADENRPAALAATEGAEATASTAVSSLKAGAAPAVPARVGLALARRDELVACEVLAGAGRVVGRVLLPVDASPPAATVWSVEVDSQGAVSVRTGSAKVVPQPALPEALRRLPPGHYLLRRQ